MIPHHESHTRCQAAPANAKQRVCLSNRTTKTTDKQMDEKNIEAITCTKQNGAIITLKKTRHIA